MENVKCVHRIQYIKVCTPYAKNKVRFARAEHASHSHRCTTFDAGSIIRTFPPQTALPHLYWLLPVPTVLEILHFSCFFKLWTVFMYQTHTRTVVDHGGDRGDKSCPQNFEWGTLMQIVPQIFKKNTVQTSPKHKPFKTKNSLLAPSHRLPLWTPLLAPNQAFWVRVSASRQNSSQI